MSLSRDLAEHVAATRFEALPATAVEAAKRSLLDAVGVMLAASSMGEGCEAFVGLARMQGEGRCTILGRGAQVGLLAAALANGALAHAIDYEDALDGLPVHPNAASIPAALALAQDMGEVSGRRLLTALAVGCDLVARLGIGLRGTPDAYGWYTPPILGAQGAAAASASLLLLDPRQVSDAFALTLGPSAQTGAFKQTPDSALRAVRDGFSAHAGLLAALLAERGVRGFEAPFEGPAGLYALFARSEPEAEAALADLGRRYLGAEISFKPWPACRGTHAAIECALAFRSEVGADDIEGVHIVGGPIQRMLAEPLAQKQAPQTAIDAKFSLPFTFAHAFLRGEVTLDSFGAGELADPAVLALARRVGFRVGEGLGLADSTGGVVELRLRKGRTLRREVVQALGHPTRPINDADLLAKFRDCAGRAHRPMRPEAIDALAEAILSLDRIEDLDEGLFPLLA